MRLWAPLFSLTVAGGMLPPALPAQAASADSALVAAGKRIFEGRGLCATCHGLQGEGILGPTLQLNAGKTAWLHTDGSQASLVTLIAEGIDPTETRIGVAMPARGGARLTDAQVAQVAAYVRALHRQPPKPAPE